MGSSMGSRSGKRGAATRARRSSISASEILIVNGRTTAAADDVSMVTAMWVLLGSGVMDDAANLDRALGKPHPWRPWVCSLGFPSSGAPRGVDPVVAREPTDSDPLGGATPVGHLP